MEMINVAELLKDCPEGMELDCTNYNGVVSLKGIIDNSRFPIKIHVVYNNECNIYCLTKYGQTWDTGDHKCIIFPKGKTTWEGFNRPFKPGDIVITDNNEHAFIYSGENDNYWECYCGVYCGTRNICVNSKQWSDKKHELRLATEEEKEKLFQVIKDNGYEWNVETKTLKKLIKPNFKDGDIVYIKTQAFEHIFIFKVSGDDRFIEGYASLSGTGLYIDGYPVCQTNDVKEIRLATEQEKEKLFDALKPTGYHWNNETKTLEKLIQPIFKAGNKVRNKNNHNIVFTITSLEEDSYICGTKPALWFDDQDKYELVPDKFDISTLKPFDKVLVRDNDKGRWDITFYELYDNTNINYPYRTLGGMIYKQCIPYEGNEHLIGLVKECDDYYKTWTNEEN